jgi:hypothetical protein
MNTDFEILSMCISLAEKLFGIDFPNKTDFDTIGKKTMGVKKAEKITPRLVKLYRQACIDRNKNRSIKKESRLTLYTVQFVQIISAIDSCDLEEHFLNKLIALFKIPEYEKFNSARHELLVYCNYKKSEHSIFSLPEGVTKTPDFKITSPFTRFVECKSVLPKNEKNSLKIEVFQESIKRNLDKLNVYGFMRITLKSSNLVEANNEFSEFIKLFLGKNDSQMVEGVYCNIHFTHIPKIKSVQDFVFNFPKKEDDIGSVEFKKVESGFNIIGVNITPFLSDNYLTPIKNQIKKAKKQFSVNNFGILHIQFPEISFLVLINIIKLHSRTIYKHLLNNKIAVLVLEFPYIEQTNNGISNVYPNISLPYLNSKIGCLPILEANPYWVNNLEIIESNEEIKCVFIEFDIDVKGKTALAFFTTKNLSIQAKIILIHTLLFIETRTLNSLTIVEFILDASIINNTNKLAYNIGAKKIAINGKIIEGKITKHNSIQN